MIFVRIIQCVVLTYVLYNILKLSTSIKLNDLVIIPKTDIGLFAALLHCLLHFKSLPIHAHSKILLNFTVYYIIALVVVLMQKYCYYRLLPSA